MGLKGIFDVGGKVGKIKFFWAVFSVIGAVFCGPLFAADPSEAISPDEVRHLQLEKADFTLWDARDKGSFDASHIQGASLPLGDAFYKASELYAKGLSPEAPDASLALKDRTAALDKSKQIVTYCNRNCKASEILAMQLKKLGFTHVRWMEEGLQAWEEKGYPVTIEIPKLRERSERGDSAEGFSEH